MAESQRPFLTVLLGGCNERENLPELLERIDGALGRLAATSEVLFINDGSTDGSREALEELRRTYRYLRVVHWPRRRGLAEVINTGFRLARGEIIIGLPADLESHPDEDIPKLLEELQKGFDVVVGWRQGRAGRKAFRSRVFNWACRKIFRQPFHDIDWIKALRREAARGIHLRSGWHRFMVPMIAHQGYRITEVPTSWYPRRYGRSKFGLRDLPVALFDAITIKFLLCYSSRPMLFFGGIGSILLFLTLLLGLSLIFLDGETINRRGAFTFLIFALLTVGISFILAGLVGELCAYHLDRSRDGAHRGTHGEDSAGGI